MRIIIAQWLFGRDFEVTVPSGGGIPLYSPLVIVLCRVFKITVLDEFRIETPISSIGDIFEEDTDEFVADGFLLCEIHVEHSLQCLRQMG